MRSITAATLILFAACRGGLLGPKRALTYAQCQSLEKGMRANTVITAFGKPVDILERDGAIRGLSYLCENAAGVAVPLRMVFDDRGRLAEWVLQERK